MRGDAAGGGGVCVSPGGGGLGEGGGRRLRRERKAVDCLAGQRAVGGVETAAGAPGRLWAPGRVKGGREGRERGHSPRGRVSRSLSANSHLFFAPPLPSQPFTQTKPTMATALASRPALTSAVSARKVRMHAEGGANRVPVPPMPAREGDEKEGPPTGRRKKKKAALSAPGRRFLGVGFAPRGPPARRLPPPRGPTAELPGNQDPGLACVGWGSRTPAPPRGPRRRRARPDEEHRQGRLFGGARRIRAARRRARPGTPASARHAHWLDDRLGEAMAWGVTGQARTAPVTGAAAGGGGGGGAGGVL